MQPAHVDRVAGPVRECVAVAARHHHRSRSSAIAASRASRIVAKISFDFAAGSPIDAIHVWSAYIPGPVPDGSDFSRAQRSISTTDPFAIGLDFSGPGS